MKRLIWANFGFGWDPNSDKSECPLKDGSELELAAGIGRVLRRSHNPCVIIGTRHIWVDGMLIMATVSVCKLVKLGRH